MSESGKRNKQNKIIRAEIPGGNPVLDGLNLMEKIQGRTSPTSEEGKIARIAYQYLDLAATEMRTHATALRQQRRIPPEER